MAEFAQRVVKVKDLHFSNVTEKKKKKNNNKKTKQSYVFKYGRAKLKLKVVG